MANNVQIGVEVVNKTKQGWRSVYATATSQQEQLQKYMTLVPLINTKSFENQFKRLQKMVQTLEKESQWSKQTLSKKGKNGWSYNLGSTMTGSLDELRQAMSDIKKEWSKGGFKGAKATLAQEWLKQAQTLEKTWTRVNNRAEKYAHIDKSAAKDKEAVRMAKKREQAEARILTYQHTIDKFKQNMSNYDGQLYRNVQKRLTAEQQIASALRMQEEIYRQVGDKKKAAMVAGQATKWENKASITSQQLENWTGNDKGLISTWTPENLKRQLNAVSRDLTNTIGRDNVLSLKLKITGWEQDVARLRDAAKSVEKSFVLGGKKFKITGYDDAVKALAQIDKMAARGVKGASAWQQKLNNYFQAHVAVANAYQTHQNRIVEGQKREARANEKIEEGLLRKGAILNRLRSLAYRYFSIFTLINIARKIAETTGYFQQQQTALEGILKSASRAQEAITEIKSMALKSPFETKEIVTQTKQLAAYGIEYEKLLPTVKMLGDLSAGLGVDMNRLILAYGQVRAASVLRGQELRQFTEAGVPMVEALKNKFNELNGTLITTGDVFELISKRQVPFEMVASVLSDMTSEGGKFYNMQEKITGTLYGQMQKLKDMWTLAMNSTGSSINTVIMRVVKALQSVVKNMTGILVGFFSTFTAIKFKEFLLLFEAQKVRMLRSLILIKQNVLNIGVSFSIWRTSISGANGAIAKLKAGIVGLGAVAKSVGVAIKTIAMSPIGVLMDIGIGVLIGKLISARDAAREFGREIRNIETSFAKQFYDQTEGLDKLVGKLAISIKGTKDYDQALETLKSNYGQYINPAIIEQLVNERKAINETGDAWYGLRDSIIAAMRAKMDYDMFGAKSTEAANKLKDRFDPLKVLDVEYKKTTGGQTGKSISDIENDIKEKYGISGAEYIDYSKKMATIINMATENFFKNLETTPEQYAKELDKQAKIYLPQVRKTLQTLSLTLYESLMSNDRIAREYMSNIELQSESYYNKIKTAFDKVERTSRQGNSFVLTGNPEIDKKTAFEFNPFKTSKEVGADYMKAILLGKDGLLGSFQKISREQLVDNTEDGIKQYGILYKNLYNALKRYSKDFQVGAIKEVSNDFMLLSNAIKDSNLNANIASLVNDLQNRIAPLSDVEARIANRLQTNYGANTPWSIETKNYIAKYAPTKGGDFETIRKQLINDYKSLQDEIDSYQDRDGEWAAYIDSLKERQKLLKILGSSQYYNIDVTGKGTDKVDKGGYRRLFNDLFGLIREARDEESKLVETTTGYTSVLKDQAKELENAPISSFYKEGNPFSKFLNDIQQYGLETDIFKASDFSGLKTKYNENGFANYQQIWMDLIELVKGKANLLRPNKEYASVVSTLDAFAIQMTAEMEKLFGKKEVERLIEKGLKELSGISNNIKSVNDRRDIINSLSGTASLNSLWSKMGFSGNYQTQNIPEEIKSAIASMIATSGGKGIYEKFKENFDRIISGGKLGLSNIPMIMSLVNDLESAIGPEGDKEFDKAKKYFIDMLNNMSKSIVELAKDTSYFSDAEREALGIQKALNDYTERNLKIEREGGDNKGTRLIDSNVQLYQDIYKIIGAEFNRELDAFGGGLDIQNLNAFNKGLESFINQIRANKLMDKLNNPDATDEDRKTLMEQAVANEKSLNGMFKLMDILINVVSSASNAVIEIANDVISVLESQNSLNNPVIEANGSVVVTSKTNKAKYEFLKESLGVMSDWSNSISNSLKSAVTLDLAGVITNIVGAVTGLISNLNKLADKSLDLYIDNITDKIENLDRQISKLEFDKQFLAGVEAIRLSYKEVDLYQKKAEEIQKQIDAELLKKEGDEEQVTQWIDEKTEATQTYINMIKQINDEIVSTGDDLASTLTDAFVEAFKNGTNAARDWRDAVKQYVGDILKQVLIEQMIAPQLQDAIDELVYGYTSLYDNEGNVTKTPQQQLLEEYRASGSGLTFQEYQNQRFGNASYLNRFVEQLNGAFDGIEAIVNELPEDIRNMIFYNSSTSSLTGGIQGITEDTARTLEGLSNSMLGQLIMINQNMGYANANLQNIDNFFSKVQTSWFADMLNSQKEIRNMIYDSYYGIRPLKVTM